MDIIVPDTRPRIFLDATMLSTVMSCARLADFRFNHHFVPLQGNSSALEMGSIVHTYLEYYYKSVISGAKKVDAVGYGIAAARAFAQDCKNTDPNDQQFALDTCELYAEHYKNDSWVPLEVEVVKSRQIYEDDEIVVGWKAKFDLLADSNNGIFPIDHKTMKQRRDTINLNNQFTGQCFLAGTRTMFVNKIGFQKTLKPAERFMRVAVNYSYDRLLEWQSIIVPYWAKQMVVWAESGYYPPNYTHCESKYGYCAFKSVCESDRGMRGEIISHDFEVGEPWSI